MGTHDFGCSNRRSDNDLLPPAERRAALALTVDSLIEQGFRLETRFTHHAVLTSPSTGRVEVFIDEYGQACWS